MVQAPPPKQEDERDRFYLTEAEVNQLIKASKEVKRHGNRNATLILMMFRHGLRTAEAISLKWSLIDLKQGKIHVQRVKNGNDSVQPLRGGELRGLRQIERDYPDSPYVFCSERKQPISARMVRTIIRDAGIRAELPFYVRPHMLRHGCGYYLANRGEDSRGIQDYLGHKYINNTVRYTKLSPKRFEGYFRD